MQPIFYSIDYSTYIYMFNEREVVARILNSDFRAFTQLVTQYEKLVFFVVNRLVINREDKEDICQEVFMKIYNNLGRFRFESKLSTWIARIAYLTAINHLEKNKNERGRDEIGSVENNYFTNDNPEVILGKKELTIILEKLVMALPDNYRSVITFYHLNEFSCREISKVMDLPEGTVKSYLYRARQLLKDEIKFRKLNNDLYE